MKRYILTFLFLLPISDIFAQPQIQWQKCYGGTKNDFPGSLIATRDGGYIMTSETISSDSDITSTHGNGDLWIVKLHADGSIQWQKTYGGSQEDGGGSILQTSDGGYIIAGATNSTDGDLEGTVNHGSTDIWILKIDSLGLIQWQKRFGGSNYDIPSGLLEAGENGYIIQAITQSDDGDVQGFHKGTGFDIWLFTISSSGNIVWQKTYGGSNDDQAYSLIRTSDGGYAITGYTFSTDGDVKGRKRDSTEEVWLLKVNAEGNILWQKTFGGSSYEEAYNVLETYDHGFILAAQTLSKDGDVTGLRSTYADAWIVKTDTAGNIIWQNTYGGTNGETPFSIIQTSDSGYVIAANTVSNDDDVSGLKGNTDCWIFKISRTGKLIWQKTLGGTFSDGNLGAGIMPTADSGFLVMSLTESVNGDVTNRKGDTTDWDIWLVKLSQDLSAVPIAAMNERNISLYPNPALTKTTISYNLEMPSQVVIELYDVLGEKLASIFHSQEESGNHEHEFDLSGFPSGSYFLRVQMNGHTDFKKVIVE